MNIIDRGQEIIESYNYSELQGKKNTAIYLARCFTPHTFNSFNFLTYLNSAEEFWKLADSQQEFRTADYGSDILGSFSEEELKLVKEISLDFGNLIKIFDRKTIPVGINHQLSSIATLRILQQLKNKEGKCPSVFEIGGGSGMLGHMCHRLGFKYSNFDITQSFYTFNSTIFEAMYKDKLYDTHAIRAVDIQQQTKIDRAITLVPWWNFVNVEFSLPEFSVVVMNHCFFEISRKALAFLITRLANEHEGRVYLIVSGWGSSQFTELNINFLRWLEGEFDFRKEEFCGDPEVNPNGTVLLSFQKTKPASNLYSVPMDQRISMQPQSKKAPSNKLKKLLSRYVSESVKPINTRLDDSLYGLKRSLYLNVLGSREPILSRSNINLAAYNKNFSDLKTLIEEIEDELGKPTYTEDEAAGFYINRMDHA